MSLRLLGLVLCGLALSGCGGGPDPSAATPEPTPSPALAGGPAPLGCEHAIPATRVTTPRGLVRPPGVRIIAASSTKRPDDPRITVVEGYVESVPGALVKAFDATRGVEVLFREDEGFEAEMLVTDGRYRTFWKTVKTCVAASKFTALFSRERAGDAVAGAAPPTKKKLKRP